MFTWVTSLKFTWVCFVPWTWTISVWQCRKYYAEKEEAITRSMVFDLCPLWALLRGKGHVSILTFLGTLLHVGKVLILLTDRERGEGVCVCSSDISCILLVLTMLEGRKLRPCLCDGIFILLSHLIDSLGRTRFKFIFLIINVTDERFDTRLILIPL